MPSVPIKYVVSFTSQDDKHPVHNLVGDGDFKKWLCNPQDRTGLMEAIFQLEHPCVISYVNVGSIWCASIEVKVGRSDWPAGREFETLVYTVSLMSPADCTLGRNPIKTEMFTTDSFCQETAKQKWDRIKVTCRQPYRKLNQFGLSFLHVKTSAQLQVTNSVNPVGKDIQASRVSTAASVSTIKQHFLGKIQNEVNTSNTELKSKLLKIAASSESGAEQDGALSRTAKLVLAASGGVKKASSHIPKITDSRKRGLYSNHVDQKYGPQFEEEVKIFLSKLSVDLTDLDNITLADVRHKFERKKKRKLTKEEKKKFAELTTEALSSVFNNIDEGIPVKSKPSITDKTTPNSTEAVFKENNHVSNYDSSKSSTPKMKNAKMDCSALVRNVTPIGKRKWDSCDDTVTPASKRLLTSKNEIDEQNIKSADKHVSLTKNSVNTVFCENHSTDKTPSHAGRKNKQKGTNADRDSDVLNSINKTYFERENAINTPHRKRKKGQKELKKDTNNQKDSDKQIDEFLRSVDCENKEVSVSDSVKKTPSRDSSFGKFLLNVTISDDDGDDDDDDEDIVFPEPKLVKRGRGRGRGRRKQRSGLESSSVSVESSPPAGKGRGRQQRGRGRGRGKLKKDQDSDYIKCQEIRPTGFAKCDGCGEYYGAELLSVHQGRCNPWKNKQQTTNDSSDSPWLCTRPESPGSSIQNRSIEARLKSPPGVMAALAAERRLKQQNSRKTDNKFVEKSYSSNMNSPNDVTIPAESSHVVEEQRKIIEQFSSLIDEPQSDLSLQIKNQSNLTNQIGSRNQHRHRNQTNRSKESVSLNGSVNQSDSRLDGVFDLTISEGDSDGENSKSSVEGFSQPVECPLCGDLLPASVIEMHAANCSL